MALLGLITQDYSPEVSLAPSIALTTVVVIVKQQTNCNRVEQLKSSASIYSR